MKKYILGIFLVFMLFLTACSGIDLSKLSDEELARISEQAVVCNDPYIRVGIECCLDNNDNSICDVDEGLIGEEPAQQQEEPEGECTDSDGGKNHDVKGYVQVLGSGRQEDSCTYHSDRDVHELYERYCDEDGNSKVEAFICPYKCAYGACIEEPDEQEQEEEQEPEIICTDSDGGKDYYVQGMVENTEYNRANWDSCNYDTIQNIDYVIEFYCDENANVRTDSIACPYKCREGACIEEPEPQDPCEDVDCFDTCDGNAITRKFDGICVEGDCLYETEECDYACEAGDCQEESLEYYCEWSWPQKVIYKDSKEVIHACDSISPYCNLYAAQEGRAECCEGKNQETDQYYGCIEP
jgi:hypothetical protein